MADPLSDSSYYDGYDAEQQSASKELPILNKTSDDLKKEAEARKTNYHDYIEYVNPPQRLNRQSVIINGERNALMLLIRRRHPKKGWDEYRRMLCTKFPSPILLQPDISKALNYTRPTNPQPYNPVPKNLVFVWDIIKQEHRAVNCNQCFVEAYVPLDKDNFLSFFKDWLSKLNAVQKMQWMGWQKI